MFRIICIILSFAFVGNQITRFHIDDVGVTFLDICVGVISSSWVIFNIPRLKKIFWDSAVGRSWIFFITAAVVSLVVNIGMLPGNAFLISFLYLLRWICYSLLFFAVRNLTSEQKMYVPYYLFIVGAILVGIGYIQYFFYSNLQNLFYLGWDDHMYRLFSVFLDPNFAAAFFVLFIVFILSKMLRRKPGKVTRRDVMQRIFLLLAVGATLLTFSRSGLIMLVFSLFMLFMLENKRKYIVLTIIGIGIFILTISQFFYLENINLLRSASTNERIKSAYNAIQIIETSPIFGVGFNAYRFAQIRMGFRQENPQIITHADAGTDNSWLFVMATTGIVGLLFFGNFLCQMFRSFTYRINGKIPVATMITVVSFVGIAVDSLFINSLFYPSIMLWLWIVWGLSDYK